MAHLLEIIGVNKSFGATRVLKNCSLNVDPSETVVVIGPSGSGKSTLLRCVNLLETLDSGDIFFEGENVTKSRRPAHLLRRQIGMVFQNFELFGHLSAIARPTCRGCAPASAWCSSSSSSIRT